MLSSKIPNKQIPVTQPNSGSDSIRYRVPSNTHNLKGETLSPKHYVYSQQ